MVWPESHVFCDKSGLAFDGDADRAACPACGADCVIGGTPTFPRWPHHCQPTPDISIGDVLQRLGTVA